MADNLMQQFQAHHDQVMKIAARLDNIERQQRNADAHHYAAAAGLLGGRSGNMSPEQVRAMNAVSEFMRRGTPMNANTTGTTDAGGGYTVPLEFDGMIFDKLLAISPMRKVSRVVRTQSPNFRAIIGQRGTGSGWVAETDARSELDSPSMQIVTPPVGTLYCYPKMTEEIANDAYFNLAEWLMTNIIDEMALQEGAAFTTGDGSKKPLGFLSGTPVATADASRAFGTLQYVPSGAATSMDADALIKMVYKLLSPYRDGACWQANSATIATIRTMKDGVGRYLWQPASNLGEPDTLLGYPIYSNESMPDVAANAYPLAFGNFQKGYLIVDLVDTQVTRDNVTQPGYIKFYARRRVGGKITDSNAIKLLKIATS